MHNIVKKEPGRAKQKKVQQEQEQTSRNHAHTIYGHLVLTWIQIDSNDNVIYQYHTPSHHRCIKRDNSSALLSLHNF